MLRGVVAAQRSLVVNVGFRPLTTATKLITALTLQLQTSPFSSASRVDFVKLPFKQPCQIDEDRRGNRMGSPSKAPLVWIDCEMTGLDRENDTIMSICCIITDHDLNLLDEAGFDAVIHHDKASLDRMDDWCTRTHGNSGLTAACLESSTTAEQAASSLLAYVQKHVPTRREGLLAGNSVHADKEYLFRGPYRSVLDHLSYRLLDVSSIKEAAKRWADPGVLARKPRKKGLHEARADILESIEEARFYREAFFKNAM